MRENRVQENAKSVTVPKTETYQYLRITMKEGGNLEEQINKGHSKKMWQNKARNRFFRGKESS